MAVLILDILKPKTCCACPCSRYNYCALTNYEPTFEEWYEDGVKDCPLVEAQEQKHGKWERNYDGIMYWWECSECHHDAWYDEEDLTNFCPNCGADMRDENE